VSCGSVQTKPIGPATPCRIARTKPIATLHPSRIARTKPIDLAESQEIAQTEPTDPAKPPEIARTKPFFMFSSQKSGWEEGGPAREVARTNPIVFQCAGEVARTNPIGLLPGGEIARTKPTVPSLTTATRIPRDRMTYGGCKLAARPMQRYEAAS